MFGTSDLLHYVKLHTSRNNLPVPLPSPRTKVHCSRTRFCSTLCNPVNCSAPGFPVLHHLPEFAQTHVHCVGDAIQVPRWSTWITARSKWLFSQLSPKHNFSIFFPGPLLYSMIRDILYPKLQKHQGHLLQVSFRIREEMKISKFGSS